MHEMYRPYDTVEEAEEVLLQKVIVHRTRAEKIVVTHLISTNNIVWINDIPAYELLTDWVGDSGYTLGVPRCIRIV